MLRVYVGAVFIIAGIAGFIEVHSQPYVPAIPASSELAPALEVREEL